MNCMSETNKSSILRIIDRLGAINDSAGSCEDCAAIDTEVCLQSPDPVLPSQQLEEPIDTAADQDSVALASDWCANTIFISGIYSKVKAARKFLKKYGLMNASSRTQFPLDGHWKTDHGLVVVIEKKTVRWSTQRASRLTFVGADRRTCSLNMYGETVQGRLVSDLVPGFAKSLTWSNGAVWHMMEGSIVGQATLLSQSMSQIVRDDSGDDMVRSRVEKNLKITSTSGLQLPSDCLHDILQCIGSTSYVLQVSFQSHESPPWATDDESDFLSRLAQHHPACQIRHEWSGGSRGLRGQRTLINGKENRQ